MILFFACCVLEISKVFSKNGHLFIQPLYDLWDIMTSTRKQQRKLFLLFEKKSFFCPLCLRILQGIQWKMVIFSSSLFMNCEISWQAQANSKKNGILLLSIDTPSFLAFFKRTYKDFRNLAIYWLLWFGSWLQFIELWKINLDFVHAIKYNLTCSNKFYLLMILEVKTRASTFFRLLLNCKWKHTGMYRFVQIQYLPNTETPDQSLLCIQFSISDDIILKVDFS